MKSGITALASLDGAPLDPADLLGLGLDPAAAGAGCALRLRDADDAAVHLRRHEDGIDALLGFLDEPAEVADRLGLPRGTPPLRLACAGVERHGDRAAALLQGGWTLLRWHAASRTMTLTASAPLRDRCHLATDGRRLAIASELVRLTRLGWVDDTLDPRGLLLTLARAPLRRALGEATIVAAVTTVAPGARVTLRADGVRRLPAAPPAPPVALDLPFDAWLERIEALLARILRQLVDRHGRVALMLSGGLDSSLLALVAARACGPDAILALTSAAPPGSGLADEAVWARATAAHLGLAIEAVVPPPDARVYRPSARALRDAERPLLGPRHYLDEAFVVAAERHGLSALLDGAGGEYGVSSHGECLAPASPRARLRHRARSTLAALRPHRAAPWPAGVFHPRLARAALERLPPDFEALWQGGAYAARRLRRDDPLGFDPGIDKVAAVPTTTSAPGVRALSPYLDRRLVALLATMPAGLAVRGATTRAPARALIGDRLPPAVAQRRRGLAYSPAYDAMMRNQAAAALDRVALHRTAGAGEWIDLDWVATALRHRAQAADPDLRRTVELQTSVLAAEFLTWWRTERC